MPPFDWKHPDYKAVWTARMRRLAWIREDASPIIGENKGQAADREERYAKRVAALKAHYREHPADFIDDWGVTFDPRNADIGLPTQIPFKLFPRQRDWIDYVLRKWHAREPGLTEKSRDCGVSWLAVALACTLCLFNQGMAIGFGANLARNVDTLDDPKSLFFKARMFMQNLPPEFTNGWNLSKDAPEMRVKFPATKSSITGEAGDQIGRGGRVAIEFVDEAAHLERPHLIEASLSQTTNCRIDISSVNGLANPFAQKRFGGKIEPFIFDWRDDPRKDDAWYQKQCDELDPVTLAQEVDRNYSASLEGVVIPNAWVRSAIDAHKKLGIIPSGARTGSMDVADEGRDKNAFAARHGIVLGTLEEWSGKGDDIFGSVEHVFNLCDLLGILRFKYDADGLGAGVRGDARVINERRANKTPPEPLIEVEAFRGSAGVVDPEGEDVKGRKNLDFFANLKAQMWWRLRKKFQDTHRAVRAIEGVASDEPIAAHDDLISLSSDLPRLQSLIAELSQPTYALNGVGKVVINKLPDGAKSPNLADAVMIEYSTVTVTPMRINPQAIVNARARR